MTHRPRALALVFGLACCITPIAGQEATGSENPAVESVAEKAFDLSRWMTTFHASPDPDRVAFVIEEMSRQGSWKKNGALDTAFLAEVFRQYPDRVAEWVSGAATLAEDERHYVYIATWWSQVPVSASVLEGAMDSETSVNRAALRKYLDRKPTPLQEMEIAGPEVLDMLWASYFAGGRAVFVERLTTALTIPLGDEVDVDLRTVRQAARWSLESNARQHADVRRILEGVTARSTGVVHDELESILASTRPDDDSEVDEGDTGP
ncbi:MAG: hypothetical protein H6825_11505 [Planctomycetes bacterium]|nr:hypothetical protein [Planctomycetota bacterium]